LASSQECQEAVASRFGIPANTLRYWQDRAKARLGAPQPGPASESPEAELRRLRRENHRLEMQCEILKKTVGIFSCPSGSGSKPSAR
jgi:transposase